ncbi:MAG TPA: type II CAAX endopeptidase family protein [Haloplasmataceae bacterium]
MNDYPRNDVPKKLFMFIFYCLTMYLLSSGIALLIYVILLRMYPNNPNNYTFTITLTNLLCYALMVFVFLFATHDYLAQEFSAFKSRFFKFLGIAIGGYILNIILSSIIQGFLASLDIIRESQNQQAIEETFKYPILAIPVVLIGAPIVEELVFRGIIFNFASNLKLPKKLNIVLAFVLSSTLFGLIHVFSAFLSSHDYTELLLGLPYIAAGFSLTLVYYKTNNLIVPMLMHFIQNFISVIVILLIDMFPQQPPVKMVSFITFLCEIF